MDKMDGGMMRAKDLRWNSFTGRIFHPKIAAPKGSELPDHGCV